MPTKYRASLDHVGFDWSKDLEIIRSKLLERGDLLFSKLGFVETRGCTCHADASGTLSVKTERNSLIDEIAGVLALAAAVKMDAGFKAANKVIATVDAVKDDPSLTVTRKVEPEALSVIASKYRRAGEPPGTHWYDVYQDEDAVEIDFQQVADAAVQASLGLQTERKKGRPPESELEILAVLREIFERYNDYSARQSALTWIDGGYKQEETGPCLTFLKIAVAPLNELLAGLPASYGAMPISAAQIMRKKANHNRRR
jgi:hypothetical protein